MAIKWSINQLDYEISKDSKSNVVTSVHWRASDSKEVTKDGEKVTYSGSSHGSIGVDSDKISEEKYKDGDEIPEGKEVYDIKEYSTTEIDPQKMDASKLVPLLVAAVQELSTKVTALEGN